MDHSRRGLRSEKKILKRLIYSIIFRFWAQCHLHGSCRYHFIYNLWLNLAGFLYTFLCFFVPKYTIIRCRTIQCSKMKNAKFLISVNSTSKECPFLYSVVRWMMEIKQSLFVLKRWRRHEKKHDFLIFLWLFYLKIPEKYPGVPDTRHSKVKDYPTRTRS